MDLFFNGMLSFLSNGVLNLPWWGVLLATLGLTHLTIISVTLYLHRCMAHRGVDLHPIASHPMRLWLWLSTGMRTLEWVAIHRKHHAKCEREGDPHSPMVFGIKKVLFEGAELYQEEALNEETLDKYGHGCPNDWVERNVYSRYSWQGVGIMLVINLMLFGVAGIAVWAVQMAWIPVTAAGIINGIGHYVGYRNYDSPDSSRNIMPWGIIIGGEELHNNHHAHGTSCKFSARKWEFDLGYGYIRILQAFKLAKIRRVAPKSQLAEVKLVDLQTLQAVLTHRYEVMAGYARSAKAACKEEAARLRAQASPAQQVESEQVRRVRRWLTRDERSLKAPQRQAIEQAIASNSVVRKMAEMKEELSRIWERSTASNQQLVEDLRAWCTKAEASGIRSLEEFSFRLRAYAA